MVTKEFFGRNLIGFNLRRRDAITLKINPLVFSGSPYMWIWIIVSAMLCLLFPVHGFGTFTRFHDSRLTTCDLSNQRMFARRQRMWELSCSVQRHRQRLWMECNTGMNLDHRLNQSFTSAKINTNKRYIEGAICYSEKTSFVPDINLLQRRKLATRSTKLFLSTEVETSTTETSTYTSKGNEKPCSNTLNFVFTEKTSVSSSKSINVNENSSSSGEKEVNKTVESFTQLDTDAGLQEERPQPTANGGFTHTSSSRAKISQANKGKVPWNKGRKRSEADKARISAGVRAKNRERLLKKIAEMGLTEEEYNAKIEQEKKQIAEEKAKRRTARGGYTPTAETKAKISKILQEKHRKGEIKRRKNNKEANRKGKKHSDETKKKISESLKARWNGDPEYKNNIKSKIKKSNSSEDVRARISNTLKEKWKDPEFRAYMMDKMAKRKPPSNTSRGDEYRKKISESMKKKWEDPNYRAKALEGMQSSMKKRTPSDRKKKVTSGLKKKKKKKKKSTVEALKLEPAIKTSQPDENKKSPTSSASSTSIKKRKKKKKKKKAKPASDSTSLPSSLIVENSEEKKQVSKMKDERRDLYDLLYGEEEREEQQYNLDLSLDGADDDEVEKDVSRDKSSFENEYSSLFEDDEEDFNVDDFDPYGLDELEQQRF